VNWFRLICCISGLVLIVGCTPTDSRSDREIIGSIADELESSLMTGDMLKIDKHLSHQAKQEGFEANRFLMECSYADSITPKLTARSIKVMDDSAHLGFVLMPEDLQYTDSLPKCLVRLIKSDTWKISTYHLTRNQHPVLLDSAGSELE